MRPLPLRKAVIRPSRTRGASTPAQLARLLLIILVGASLLAGAPAVLRAQEADEPRSMTVSGLILANYQYHVEDGTDPAHDEQVRAGLERSRFMLERVYLTARARLSEQANVRLTFESREGASGQELRVKYAYLEYRLPVLRQAGTFVRAGLVQNIMIAHEEDYWPRLVSSAPLARAGYYSSSDLGVAVGANLPRQLGEVYVEVVDGRGYQGMKAPDDRFRDVAARITLTPFAANDRAGIFRSLSISPWAYMGDTASVFGPGSAQAGTPGYLGPVSAGRRRDRMGVLVGVDDRRLSAAVSLARRKNDLDTGSNTEGSPVGVKSRSATLASAFMMVRPMALVRPTGPAPLGIVLRYDQVDTDRSAPGHYSYVAGGVTYDVSPGVSLSLDYQEVLPHAGQPPTRSTQRQVYSIHLRADF